MRFIPYDNGTYLVRSRSRDGHHIVDINEFTCSCEGYQFYQTCDHLAAAIKKFYGVTRKPHREPWLEVAMGL